MDMNNKVVDFETARADVDRWLDHKRVSPSKRTNMNDSIDTLTDAIMDGYLSIDSECRITQKLRFPLGEDESIGTLVFKPRLSNMEAKKYLKDIKSSDIDGRLTSYVSALTGVGKDIINKLDSEDTGIANAVAV